MRTLHGRGPAQPTTICLAATLIAMWLLGACTPTQLVVTDAPPLAGIRTVYVAPFASGDGGAHAAAAMTQALKARLHEDGFFRWSKIPRALMPISEGRSGNGLEADWTGQGPGRP
jgi:hypothetical protein